MNKVITYDLLFFTITTETTMDKNLLRQNWKKVQKDWKEVAQNLAYITWFIDIGTQQVRKYQSEEYYGVRQAIVEFQFPKIERTWGDGKVWHHIKWEKMKISKYKSDSPEINSAKMTNIILAWWALSLPAENELCAQFFKKELFNKPIIIVSVNNEGNDGNTYDNIIDFVKLDKEVVDWLPEFKPFDNNNSYFDLYNFNQEEYDSLQQFHRDTIDKSPERSQATKAQVQTPIDSYDSSLPF